MVVLVDSHASGPIWQVRHTGRYVSRHSEPVRMGRPRQTGLKASLAAVRR